MKDMRLFILKYALWLLFYEEYEILSTSEWKQIIFQN